MNRPAGTASPETTTRLEDIARRLSTLPRDKQDAFVSYLEQRGINVLGLPIVAAPRPERLPLSSAQRRLWLLDKLHPDSALYNVPRVFALAGPLDTAALGRALTALVARHEALRTTFSEIDGEPVQVIGAPPEIALDPIDVPEPEARALADRETHRPFDLARGPLFRPVLLRLRDELHWLVLTSHHIVMDEWSDEIIARELIELYDAARRGRPAQLAPLPVQYADYALWQHRWQTEQQLAQELAYWTARLGGDDYVLSLPGDFPGAAMPSQTAASFDFRIDRALADQLRALSARNNTTLFTTLLAVFHIVLHRSTGRREIRVGSPIANRHRREVEGVVGCFANTQVLTSQVRGGQTFIDYLGELRRTGIEAQANQALPFERLVEALQPVRRASHTPLFQVLFSWHRGMADQAPGAGGLAITQERVDDRGAKFDLVLHMTDDETGVGGELLYRAERYAPRTMAALAERFTRLCAAIAERAERPIAALAWLADAERTQLVDAWNATAVVRSFSGLHQIIEAHAHQTPDAPAVQAEHDRLSYRALDVRASQLASRLVALGVGLDTRVGLCIPRSIDMVVAMLGILKAGAAYVPLDPRAPAARLREMLGDAGIAVVLAPADAIARLTELGVHAIEAAGDATGEPHPGVAVTPETAAYVLYTSGSTGRPKGVVVSHGAITSYALGVVERLALPRGAAMAMVSTATADLGNTVLFGALVSGGLLHVVPEDRCFDPDRMADYVRTHAIDVVKITPSHLGGLLQAATPGDVLPRHALILGGEAASAELLAQVRRHGRCRVINHYGPTETTVGVLTYELVATAEPPQGLPLGRPLPNTQAYILDGDLSPVPPGIFGELYIGGDGLARGYLHRPDATADRFIPDRFRPGGGRLYRTGDRARYRADGAIEFAGRADDQIKLRGHRIEPGEIRAALLRVPGVVDAHVMLREAASGSARLVAYLVASSGATDDAAMRTALAAWLPEPMMPSDFVWLDRFPVTPNGKIDRHALPDPSTPVAQTGSTGPRSELEQRITEVWQAVLRVEAIGVDDNFFTLGGESLLAFQVVAQLRKLGVVISIPQLFEHQTVAKLAQVARRAEASDDAPAQVAEGSVELTPIQRWYFAQNPERPEHYNQSVLLEWRDPVDVAALETAVTHVAAHHDALRLRFRRDLDTGAWQQSYTADPAPQLCEVADLSDVADDEVAAAIASLGGRVQRSLDLATGPVFRAVQIDLGPQRTSRLLVVAHHLVVDGMSWRILLGDLASAYRDAAAGNAPSLAPAGATFQDWSAALVAHATSDALTSEITYWQDVLGADPGLPSSGDEAGNTVASARTIGVALTEDETTALLTQAPAAYRTRIDDLLLTALALTLCEWTGQGSALINLEGHGRAPLGTDGESPDVSRTVGWFTATHPIGLAPQPGDLAASLKHIKEQLRAVPRRGVGYGILRHLTGALTGDEPRLTFNYLGQFDQTFDEAGLFRPASEPAGDERDPDARRDRWLDVIGMVEGGQLGLEWHYSPALHAPDVIERLAARYLHHLRAVIAHCTTGVRGATPSDFPLAGLRQAELDALPVPLVEVADLYPLTPIQEGILFHCLMAPGEGLYITQRTIEIDRDISLEALRGAWQAAIDAHDVLRTGFLVDGLERPVQVVARAAPLPFEVIDLRGVPAAEHPDARDRLLAADRARGFDLARAPLMRITVLRLGDAHWQLVWTDHHLLLDGWSCWRILSEVFGRYAALTGGEPVVAHRAPPFRDYVAWLAARDRMESEAFWADELGTFEAPTPLAPQLATLADDRDAGFARQETFLSREATAQLQQFARAQSITINTLVQGALALALGLYTGKSDVVFGVTVAGRPDTLPGADDMVGLFINTLPLRVSLEPGQQVATWLRTLQRRNAAMREHEHTPLVRAQALSGVPRGAPLFDTLLVFENYPIDRELGPAADDLGVGAIAALERTNYPVTVEVVPGEQLLIQLDHDRDTVGAAAARAMIQRISRALEVLAAASDTTRLADLALLDASELRRLHAWNQTAAPRPHGAVHEQFATHVARTPDAVAVVGARTLTYRELDTLAHRLAGRMAAAGVGPESIVGVSVERSVEMVAGLLAILKTGAAYLPLDPAYPADRIAYMIDDARPDLVLADAAQCDTAWGRGERVWNLDRVIAELGERDMLRAPVRARPGNLAYCIYTSGSTGRPKGVAVAHASLGNFLATMTEHLGATAEDRFLALTSLSFDIAALELWLPLTLGGRIVLAQREEAADAERLIARLREGSVTVVQATPTTWRTLAREHEGAALPAHCKLLCGGEALPPDLAARLLARAPRVFNVYGPTETTVWSTLHVLDAERPAPSIGRPIGNTSIHLLDGNLRPVPVGVAGELYIGGLGLARGYLRRPALTADRFLPDPFGERGGRMYRTGDLARRDPDGTITCLGRTDDQLKLRGHRIELGEIEARLRSHAGVAHAAVAARALAGRGLSPAGSEAEWQSGSIEAGEPQLVAYIVMARPHGDLERVLREHVQALPEPMRPQHYVFLEALPQTANGKLDRKALPAPAGAARPAHVAPRTENERALAAIWQRLLAPAALGVHDDFFALGGDSVVALQLISAARGVGITLAPRDVFEHPTIEGLAAAARTTTSRGVDQPLPRVDVVPDGALDTLARSRLVVLRGPIDLAVLDQALRAVERHHDALRLRVHRAAASSLRFSIASLASESAAARVQTIDAGAAQDPARIVAHVHQAASRRLSLQHGPLLVATVAEGEPKHLIITAHALAVDAASWAIVLEDVATAYHQITAGQPPALPAPTSSFQRWADAIVARTDASDEVAVRAELTSALAAQPPSAGAGDRSRDRTVRIELDAASTTALISELPERHRARPDEVFTAALTAALCRWTGRAELWVELESTARRISDGDLGRTVGNCTAPLPVLLRDHADPRERLQHVKAGLRRLSDGGLGYAQLAGPRPRVRLCFLDATPRIDPSAAFHASDAALDAAPETGASLVVTGAPRDGGLTLAITTTGADACHDVHRLADDLLVELLRTIDLLRSQAPEARPDDFAHVALDRREVDELFEDLDG